MADPTLVKGEKVVVVQDSYPNPNQDPDFYTQMQGDAHQEGGRFDTQDRGMGSGIGVPQVPEHYAEPPEPTPQAEFVPGQDPGAQPAQEPAPNYQQMYGESENQKGEIRRERDTAQEKLQKAEAELAAMKAAGWGAQPGYPATSATSVYPPGTPNYTVPPTYPQQPPVQNLPQTFFPDKEADSYAEVKDLDVLVQREIAPAYFQLQNQVLNMQQQLLQNAKAQAGLTPVKEQELAMKYPWLMQTPDGPARIQAMSEMMKREEQAATPPTTPTAPQPQAPQGASPEQMAARRVTYIETGKQARAEPAQTEDQRMLQEWTTLKTAEEKRKFLEQHGAFRVNEWGPGVLTR